MGHKRTVRTIYITSQAETTGTTVNDILGGISHAGYIRQVVIAASSGGGTDCTADRGHRGGIGRRVPSARQYFRDGSERPQYPEMEDW